MLQINKILFPTDFSACAEHAFSHAAHLASRFDADLHVLHVTEMGRGAPGALLSDPLIDETAILEELHLATRSWRPPGQKQDGRLIQTHAQGASAAESILNYVDRHGIDLVVMGTHGRRGVDHFLMGSVAEAVVRRAACPVLTVKDDEVPRGTAIRRILVPVDFSEYTQPLLSHAQELAAAYGAQVELLHVIEEAILPYVYGIEPASLSTADVQAHTRLALEEMLRNTGIGEAAGDVHVLIGQPALGIIDFARQQEADLIVIATHGRTGLKRFLMGSVAEKVVRMAPCPVFTVKNGVHRLLKPPAAAAAAAG